VRHRRLLRFLVLALLGLAVAAALFQFRGGTVAPQEAAAQAEPGDIIGQARPGFRLPDRHGRLRDATEWDGRVLMVNFWASWCIPCRREIPEFIALQREYEAEGLQIVGIALDEQAQIDRFLAGIGVDLNYPSLVSPDLAGIELARAYGNGIGILPHTVVVDRRGRIAFVQFGELSRAQAERAILPLLRPAAS
jgi:thiol-disulfide isomerase/thioredoxin